MVSASDLSLQGGSVGGLSVAEGTISVGEILKLKDSGQITGSNVLFTGGTIGGFELSSTQINYMEDSANFADKYSWQNLASEALFYIMSGHGWNPFNDVVEAEMEFLGAQVEEYDEVGWDQSEIDKMPSPYQYYQDTIYAN